MAQYMRFWQYPETGVGTGCFTVTIDGASATKCLRGGDGSGGAYNWDQMPYSTRRSTTDAQRRAIGALVYDAGVAVGMNYESDSSYAYLSDATVALVDTFGYSNAVFAYNSYDSYNIGEGLYGMVNPNLDSGNPVLLGIYGYDSGGHAIAADGYGYQGSTMYHHLNMGWYGLNDIWYNLPNINTSLSSFDVVDAAVYNIYTSGTGEIVSGRVTAADSKTPIAAAAVTAVRDGGLTYQTKTNTKGIYAFAAVPSDSTYTISVAIPGYAFHDQVAATGSSLDYEVVSGNCWAIDFQAMIGVCKCKVSVGKKHNDAVSFSGTLSVTPDEIAAAAEIEIDINSDDRANSSVQTFPVNATTYKNGKFKCAINNIPLKTSFVFDTKTSKFSFAAKNVDLSGLSCPLTVRMVIGDYSAQAEVNEAVVNAKKPIPIKLLMGVKDSLRIDKSKFTRDRNTDNVTQIAISGGFSVEDLNDANMVDADFVVGLAGQTFTIPLGSFKPGKNKFSCSRIVLLPGGEIAAAAFDFSKCAFTLTIKNTNFAADHSSAELDIDFAGFSGDASVSL
jgi:hypothetical protein